MQNQKFRLTRLAKADLQSIKDYIANYNPTAASRFMGKLKDKCQVLAEYPGLGTMRNEYFGLYKFPVDDYLIFYRPY